MLYDFNGATKVITLDSGVLTVDTLNVLDIWSRWIDWTLTGDNSKYLPSFSSVGGNDIDPSQGTSIPIYVFLENGWRIKPSEHNHVVNVAGGILLVNGGGDPFINTIGNYQIRINYQQPVQAIGVASGSTPTSERIKKNTAFDNFQFLMIQSSNHVAPATGLAVTGEVILDNGAFVTLSNSVVEIGNGMYRVNLTAGELNGNIVTLRFTAAGADPRYITIVTA